ncbi:uncharacterized protein LOC130166552 [Seriola aureovittata]|uniref:uncharacterized protein LOC130166552 n=1 Tax=Seriola aureovittata TaxID=2871759 RepID=UPI0024BE48FC|nr:uncharacterized protein LOC130166552 [Seriola aureovittata]
MLCLFLFSLLGVVISSHEWISGSASVVTVTPGDNITLYCDRKSSSGVYKIAWFRNCSHENQPSLVLKLERNSGIDSNVQNHGLRFHLVKNQSSNSYDLQIMNITDSDEGLYYCGAEQTKVDARVSSIYRYGNVTTRILLNTSQPHHCETPQDCGVCWRLLFSLCPAVAVLSSLFSSLLLYHLSLRKAKEPQADKKRSDTRRSVPRDNQDENLCYAALEIRQTSERPKKKKTQTSDFSTYSAIKTRT